MKTIVALSTPPFQSAIHIIRVSGDDCYQCVQQLTKDKVIKKGYTIQKVTLNDKSQKLDEVLLNKFVAPKSYTGEDLIEINCHGSLYIANRIISALIKNGATLAKRGEFTERAFLNNKISLIQSEAINNLINSSNEVAMKIGLNGLSNKTNKILKTIRDDIFKILGQVEVDIDYPEYESVPDISKEEIKNIFNKSINVLTNIVNDSNKVIKAKDGIDVAIIGKPNVGKSSLLNSLLKEDKAIVSNVPGTTRDTIESSCIINGLKFNFIDTAGIRKTNSKLEHLGIAKSKNALKEADLVILVIDNSKKINNDDKTLLKLAKNKNTIIVLNKSDLKKVNKINGVYVSAKKNKISELVNELSNYNNLKDINLDGKFILQTQESIDQLNNVLANISKARKIYNSKNQTELSADYLHDSVDTLDSILGLSKDISFIEEMFSKFCIGK